MERRDYILRLIQQLGRLFSRARELLAGGQSAAAQEELERAAAGLGGGLARALTDDSLIALLTVGGEPDVAKRVVLAELFYVEALRARERGAVGETQRLFARSLRLYRSLTADQVTLETLGVAGRV